MSSEPELLSLSTHILTVDFAIPYSLLISANDGTGSELSDGLVITSDNVKYPILADKATAEYAILDPMTMVPLPAHITASTGMDTLSHAAEAYTSTAATTFTDMISEKIMAIVAEWLPIAVADGENLEAREKLSVAACLGGWMLQHAHSNAGHSIAHVLGGRFHIPHGCACAYSLPEVLRYNAVAMPQKTRWIGELFGAKMDDYESAESIGEKTRSAVIHFRDEVIGIASAKDYAQSISEEALEAAAQETAEELFQMFNPVKMDSVQAKKILKDIFE
jgi:alcohol dehydrogenase class IV